MNTKGFTLLELLVSATIIGVLTIIGVVSYGSVNKRSRDVKRKSDLEQIRSALEMYRSDNGFYPAANGGSWGVASNLSSSLVTSNYTPSIPSDPQKPSYLYYYVATNQNVANNNYYGYCLCGHIETQPVDPSTCTAIAIPNQVCNYGLKNP
jgi:general secretion pathway protein G